MTLGEIIKRYRQQRSLSMDAFAEKCGLSKAYISLLEKNRHPKTGKPIAPSIQVIKQVADGIGVDFNLLFSMIDGDATLPSEANNLCVRAVRIPVLGYVRAGIPIDAVEEILDYEEITPELAATGDFFALKIKGDSMIPQIADGDVVIVRQQPDVESGEVAVVIVNGDDATIKQVKKYDDPSEGISLVPFNPAYAVMRFTPEEIISRPVEIIGKVIELRRTF